MANGMFSEELALFQRHRHEWLGIYPGKFVAIQDAEVKGFFDTYAEAFRAGLESFGVQRNFLVKQVWKTEPVYVVS